jgi:hypothetical protein
MKRRVKHRSEAAAFFLRRNLQRGKKYPAEKEWFDA